MGSAADAVRMPRLLSSNESIKGAEMQEMLLFREVLMQERQREIADAVRNASWYEPKAERDRPARVRLPRRWAVRRRLRHA